MSKHIAFRVNKQRQAKLESIMQVLGVNRTDALTALIDGAVLVEVKSVKPVVTLAANENTGAMVSQARAGVEKTNQF